MKNIGGARHRCGAGFDKVVGTRRGRARNVPWYGQYLSPLLERKAGGVQGAALRRRFGNKQRIAKRRGNTVARNEINRVDWLPRPIFAQQRPALLDNSV